MEPKKGFILIELIVTIILVGIIGIFAGLFLYTGFNGYLNAKETAEGALKAQIALDRISLELKDIDSITAFNANTSIAYTSVTLPGARSIQYNAGSDTISIGVDGNFNVVLDNVSEFNLTTTNVDLDNSGDGNNEIAHIDLSFRISLTTTPGISPRLFSTQIYPRNMLPEPP
jgi:type II secretory pathway pseudopilin PulG